MNKNIPICPKCGNDTVHEVIKEWRTVHCGKCDYQLHVNLNIEYSLCPWNERVFATHYLALRGSKDLVNDRILELVFLYYMQEHETGKSGKFLGEHKDNDRAWELYNQYKNNEPNSTSERYPVSDVVNERPKGSE